MITRQTPVDALPNVMTGPEAAAAIGISRTQYFRLRAHRLFPLKPLNQPGSPRYSKVAVQQHLESRGQSHQALQARTSASKQTQRHAHVVDRASHPVG